MKDDSQDCCQAFPVDGHLNGDMRKGVVDGWVGKRGDSGIIATVLVILGNGANSKGNGLYDLQGEELGEL